MCPTQGPQPSDAGEARTRGRASTREIRSSGVSEQHRRRPACAFAQTDQRLCYSLIKKYHIQTCYERKFNLLAGLCSWRDWFETCFVGNPEDKFSRDKACLLLTLWSTCHWTLFGPCRFGTAICSKTFLTVSFWIPLQKTVKTQINCHITRHFIRVCTVYLQ